MIFSMCEFAITLALQRTYNFGGGWIFSGSPGLETLRGSFHLEFQIFLNEMA